MERSSTRAGATGSAAGRADPGRRKTAAQSRRTARPLLSGCTNPARLHLVGGVFLHVSLVFQLLCSGFVALFFGEIGLGFGHARLRVEDFALRFGDVVGLFAGFFVGTVTCGEREREAAAISSLLGAIRAQLLLPTPLRLQRCRGSRCRRGPCG